MAEIELIDAQLVGVQRGDGVIAGHYSQRVGEILNANEEDRINSDENWSKADPDMKKVARIPRVVYMQLQQAGVVDDPQQLLQFLERNPQYKVTDKKFADKGREIYV